MKKNKKISRRQFIEQTAIVGAAAAACLPNIYPISPNRHMWNW
jgi:hypothetical protein